MRTSFLTKIAIAAAATMVTLSPALADRGHRGDHRGHDHRYERGYDRGYDRHSHSDRHHHFRKHRFAKRFWGKPRFYPGYGYNPYYRRWY
jgi:Ni/Co efflux regulator RcnB